MRDPTPAIRCLILALCAIPILSAASSGTQAAGSAQPSDLGWPRQYSGGDARLVLYQPQVDTWADYKKLTARIAAALFTNKGSQPVWGVLSIESGTLVSLESRTVTFQDFRVTGMSFSSAKDDAEAKVWVAIATKLLPAYPTTVALDRILAYIDKNQLNARQTEVLLVPPPILVSTQPAMLVIIDGKPILIDIDSTKLQKVVNTNWDLFFDVKGGRYYLRDEKVWLSAKALTDAWMPVTKLPEDFSRLPATDPYKDMLPSVAKPQKPSTV